MNYLKNTNDNNNGIISRTKDAKEENRGASVQEQRDLWMADKSVSSYFNDNGESLDDLLERLGPDGENLLTNDEIETIKDTSQIKIGSRTIDFRLTGDEDYFANNEYRVIYNDESTAYVLKNTGELFKFGNNINESGWYEFSEENAQLVVSNVKKFCGTSFFINNDNQLFYASRPTDIVANNVKFAENNSYTTLDGKVYISIIIHELGPS